MALVAVNSNQSDVIKEGTEWRFFDIPVIVKNFEQTEVPGIYLMLLEREDTKELIWVRWYCEDVNSTEIPKIGMSYKVKLELRKTSHILGKDGKAYENVEEKTVEENGEMVTKNFKSYYPYVGVKEIKKYVR